MISHDHEKAFITADEFKKLASEKFPLVVKSMKFNQSPKEKNVEKVTNNTAFKWPETELREVKALEKKRTI